MPGAHDAIRGVEQINKVIRVDQQPLGNTPTSNPATYTGVFDLIRATVRAIARGEAARLHAAAVQLQRARRPLRSVRRQRPEADRNALSARRVGRVRHLPRPALQPRDAGRARYHGQSIADVLDMSCGQAVKLFENIPKIRRILQTLCDVGLDYLTLGQPAPTLSGGEAQRVKLAAELSRPDTGRTLYLLDEPTTGLHFDDLAKLLDVLNRLVDLGNTVVVIEHNLDVIKTADWIIDMGPEAGEGGGYVVAEGTPEEVVEASQKSKADSDAAIKGEAEGGRRKTEVKTPVSPCQAGEPPEFSSHTADALAPVLAAGPHRRAQSRTISPPPTAKRAGDLDIDEVGSEPKCRGKSTAAAGTRTIASAATASRAAGTAEFWSGSSIAFTNSASSVRHELERPQRRRNCAPRKKPTAGSCTRSPASSGC